MVHRDHPYIQDLLEILLLLFLQGNLTYLQAKLQIWVSVVLKYYAEVKFHHIAVPFDTPLGNCTYHFPA